MSNSKELQRDKEYKATVPVFPDLYIVQRHASHNVLVQLGLEPFEVHISAILILCLPYCIMNDVYKTM